MEMFCTSVISTTGHINEENVTGTILRFCAGYKRSGGSLSGLLGQRGRERGEALVKNCSHHQQLCQFVLLSAF